MRKESFSVRKLEALRLAAGFKSSASLAKAAGVHPTTMSRIKRPGANIESDTLQKLATTLKVPVTAFMDVEEEEKPIVNLNADVYIEIKGRVWATPDRISIQALKGRFIKGNPGEQDCFGVEVEGDSMIPAYVPGDIAIVRPRECVLSPYSEADDENVFVPVEHMMKFHNRDAVVEHNGEAMLKRIQIVKKGGPKYEVQMLSLNEKYPTLKVRFGDEWRVRGVVTRVQKPELDL